MNNKILIAVLLSFVALSLNAREIRAEPKKEQKNNDTPAATKINIVVCNHVSDIDTTIGYTIFYKDNSPAQTGTLPQNGSVYSDRIVTTSNPVNNIFAVQIHASNQNWVHTPETVSGRFPATTYYVNEEDGTASVGTFYVTMNETNNIYYDLAYLNESWYEADGCPPMPSTPCKNLTYASSPCQF